MNTRLAISSYRALQQLRSIGHHGGEETRENPVSTLTARDDRVTLSAWSITFSRQTTALIQTGGGLPASPGEVESPLSPKEQIAEMAELVGKLKDEGKISWRRARHLQKTLDLAAKALEHGRALPAARLLRHVARVADKLADHDRMPGDAAAELIGSARSIVDQLREADTCSKLNEPVFENPRSEWLGT